MTDAGESFWRGYLPLLVAFGAAQLSQQVDIFAVGRLEGGAAGAYVALSRLAFVDMATMAAMGTVASAATAQSREGDKAAQVIGGALCLAMCVGVCCAVFGLSFYPLAAQWMVGDVGVAELVRSGIFWYALGSPLRFLANTSAFILHALGHGPWVVRWKLIEVVAKTALNWLVMQALGLGFVGCFLSSLIISALSWIWCTRMLLPYAEKLIVIPNLTWAIQFLRSTAWEGQRMASAQLAVLVCLVLFAAPGLGNYDVARLNAYATGQTLMLAVFAPFMAQLRFLTFRLTSFCKGRSVFSMWAALSRGAALAVCGALCLLALQDWIGALYGQRGPWWSTLVQALAVSLPLRFAANFLRARLLSQGDFALVAATDSAALWLLAVPLVAIGLFADSPFVAYLSLILPEAASAAWLWRRLRHSHEGALGASGFWRTPKDFFSARRRA